MSTKYGLCLSPAEWALIMAALNAYDEDDGIGGWREALQLSRKISAGFWSMEVSDE